MKSYFKELMENDGFQLKKVDVPDKYKQAEQYKLHPTFLNPPGKLIACCSSIRRSQMLTHSLRQPGVYQYKVVLGQQ